MGALCRGVDLAAMLNYQITQFISCHRNLYEARRLGRTPGDRLKKRVALWA